MPRQLETARYAHELVAGTRGRYRVSLNRVGESDGGEQVDLVMDNFRVVDLGAQAPRPTAPLPGPGDRQEESGQPRGSLERDPQVAGLLPERIERHLHPAEVVPIAALGGVGGTVHDGGGGSRRHGPRRRRA